MLFILLRNIHFILDFLKAFKMSRTTSEKGEQFLQQCVDKYDETEN